MKKDVLNELRKVMDERHIKIPALSKKLDIPKDRIYKWFQQGTKPKYDDLSKLWDWINGETANKFVLEDSGENYKTKYIELLEKTLKEKDERIKELEGGQAPPASPITEDQISEHPTRKKVS